MRSFRLGALALCLALASTAAMPAMAAGTTTCKMSYSLSGWSAFYKTASGRGTVTCSNGQSLSVKIVAKGGGLTFGKYRVDNGFGEFANVSDIRDVLGSYATAEAHAGAEKNASAQAMTNGDVSLALSGKGEGWSLGVAFSKFTISRR